MALTLKISHGDEEMSIADDTYGLQLIYQDSEKRILDHFIINQEELRLLLKKRSNDAFDGYQKHLMDKGTSLEEVTRQAMEKVG